MKAAAYIEKYNAFRAEGDDPSAACGGLAIMLLQEVPKICRARKAKSTEAALSIWKEINQKWKAIYRRLPDEDRKFVRVDGFARAARSEMSVVLCAYLDTCGVLKVQQD